MTVRTSVPAVGRRLHAKMERLVRGAVADRVGDLLVDRDATAPSRQRAVATHLVALVQLAPSEERHALLVGLTRRLVVHGQVESPENEELVFERRERLEHRTGEVIVFGSSMLPFGV